MREDQRSTKFGRLMDDPSLRQGGDLLLCDSKAIWNQFKGWVSKLACSHSLNMSTVTKIVVDRPVLKVGCTLGEGILAHS